MPLLVLLIEPAACWHRRILAYYWRATKGWPMPELMPFAGDPLDRVSNERHDESWVEERLHDGTTRFLPLWRLQAPCANGDEPRLVWTDGSALSHLKEGCQNAL